MMTFEQEYEALKRLQPDLHEQYGSQYVAIYQGEVVGSGPHKFDLLRQVYATYGEVPCTIEKADAEGLRTVRITSVWVKREDGTNQPPRWKMLTDEEEVDDL